MEISVRFKRLAGPLVALALLSGCGIRVNDRPQDMPVEGGLPPCTADLPFGDLFRQTIECMSPVTFPKVDPFEKAPPYTLLEKANIQYMLCLNRQDAQRKSRQRVETCIDPKNPRP